MNDRKKFPNKLVVDNLKCFNWRLPWIFFSIEYPKEVEAVFPKPYNDNENYLTFNKYEKNILNESLVLGTLIDGSALMGTGGPRQDEKERDQIFDNLLYENIDNFVAQLENGTIIYKGRKKFMGQDLCQVHIEYEIKKITKKHLGKYRMLITYVKPIQYGPQGLLVMFTASEQSEIKSFEDFETKGIISQIWGTFSRIEEKDLREELENKKYEEKKKLADFKDLQVFSINMSNCGKMYSTDFSLAFPKEQLLMDSIESGGYLTLYDKLTYNEFIRIQPDHGAFFCPTDSLRIESAISLAEDIKSKKSNCSIVFAGKFNFQEKPVFGVQYTYEGKNEKGKKGKFKGMNFNMPYQSATDIDLNIIFETSEKSEIKTFEDFGEKGLTGQVWKTFRFTEY